MGTRAWVSLFAVLAICAAIGAAYDQHYASSCVAAVAPSPKPSASIDPKLRELILKKEEQILAQQAGDRAFVHSASTPAPNPKTTTSATAFVWENTELCQYPLSAIALWIASVVLVLVAVGLWIRNGST